MREKIEKNMNENDNVRLRQMNWNGWLNHTLNYKSSAVSVVGIAFMWKITYLKQLLLQSLTDEMKRINRKHEQCKCELKS